MTEAYTHFEHISCSSKPKRKVLFVHGLISSSIVFKKIIPLLDNTTAEYILYDLYGRGKSDAPNAIYSLDFYVQQLSEMIHKINFSNNDTIVGLSWGCGIIAKYLLTLNAISPKQIIFLAPGGLYSPNAYVQKFIKIPYLSNALMILGRKNLITKDFQNCFHNPAKHLDFYELIQKEIIENMLFTKTFFSTIKNSPIFFHDLYESLFATNINISIIWGLNDKKSPYHKNVSFFNHYEIPIDTIKNCGHLVTWEEPEIVAKILMEKICHI